MIIYCENPGFGQFLSRRLSGKFPMHKTSPDISQRTLQNRAFVQILHFHDFKILTYY